MGWAFCKQTSSADPPRHDGNFPIGARGGRFGQTRCVSAPRGPGMAAGFRAKAALCAFCMVPVSVARRFAGEAFICAHDDDGTGAICVGFAPRSDPARLAVPSAAFRYVAGMNDESGLIRLHVRSLPVKGLYAPVPHGQNSAGGEKASRIHDAGASRLPNAARRGAGGLRIFVVEPKTPP